MRPHKTKTINTIFFRLLLWSDHFSVHFHHLFHLACKHYTHHIHHIPPHKRTSDWTIDLVLLAIRFILLSLSFFLFLFVCLFPSLFSLEFFFRFFLDTYCYSLLFVSCVPIFSCRVCIFIKLMSIHPSFVMNIDMLPIFLCFPPAYSVHCCRANSDCCCCYWIIVDGDRLKKSRFYA